MNVIKLCSVRRGAHIHTTVFYGPFDQTKQNLGVLVSDIGQWQEIGAALKLGAERMHGRLAVVFEGDNEIVGSER